MMLRGWLLPVQLAFGVTSAAQTVSIGVFSLFHATQLRVMPAGSPILITVTGHAPVLLTGERGSQAAAIRLDGKGMLLGQYRVTSIKVGARDGSETEFVLAIPGKITRRFRGALTVTVKDQQLVPVVRMDIETAVASIVSAESVPGAGQEALKAQAVAARSYLEAGGRHRDYDFCDSTHCQFLRSPPAHGSPSDRAAKETQGLVLTWHGQVLAAMYSSRCGGRTVSLRQIGIPTEGYPYFSVVCAWCRRHPLLDAGRDSKPHRGVPEINDGHGHGLGLCQYDAAGMAESGAKFDAILRHYYPETELKELSELRASLP
ncbi:MAG: SpoIID/LytB domain-containing protein [Silvibacterium sp.]